MIPCEHDFGGKMEAKDTGNTIVYRDFHYEDGRKAGRKQVVEFTRMLITQLDSQHGFIKRLEASPDWQAKLKEWGINP